MLDCRPVCRHCQGNNSAFQTTLIKGTKQVLLPRERTGAVFVETKILGESGIMDGEDLGVKFDWTEDLV